MNIVARGKRSMTFKTAHILVRFLWEKDHGRFINVGGLLLSCYSINKPISFHFTSLSNHASYLYSLLTQNECFNKHNRFYSKMQRFTNYLGIFLFRLCRQYLECFFFSIEWLNDKFGMCNIYNGLPSSEGFIANDQVTIYSKLCIM